MDVPDVVKSYAETAAATSTVGFRRGGPEGIYSNPAVPIPQASPRTTTTSAASRHGGKVHNVVGYFDRLALLEQLGLAPASAKATT